MNNQGRLGYLVGLIKGGLKMTKAEEIREILKLTKAVEMLEVRVLQMKQRISRNEVEVAEAFWIDIEEKGR